MKKENEISTTCQRGVKERTSEPQEKQPRRGSSHHHGFSQDERPGQQEGPRSLLQLREKAYFEKYMGHIKVSLGLVHRMQGEEAEHQFNKLAKRSLRIAVKRGKRHRRDHRAGPQDTRVRWSLQRSRWCHAVSGRQRGRVSAKERRQCRKNRTNVDQRQRRKYNDRHMNIATST